MRFSDNAEAYFESQEGQICTSNKTLDHLKTPKLSQEQMDELLSTHKLRYKEEICMLLSDYRAKFDKWLLLLREDFNIVTFGFGSKKQLLQEFHSTKLHDRNCVVVNGFFPSLTIKHLLTSISQDVLDMKAQAYSDVMEQVREICRVADEAEEQLYLIVHNIDGPMLRNERAQSVLASLAAHDRFHLICSIDHINAPLIWDQQKLTKFNFVWFDTTTYLPYREETRSV